MTGRGKEAGAQPRQTARFLVLYALASGGGAAAYVPFLTLILPQRLTALAGAADVRWLSVTTFVGAVAASLSAIVFGWASDRTHNRRGWIIAGLALSSTLLLAINQLDSPLMLVGAVFAWQVALNMMLAPLAAWAGDCVPDGQKGLLGGLLSLSPGIGALAGALVTIPGLAGPGERLPLVAVLVAALVLPAVLLGRPRPMPHLMVRAPDALPEERRAARTGVRVMWSARLLVQIAESALFAFLLLWFRSIDPAITDHRVAKLFTAVLFVAVPTALIAGRWSDRAGRPMLPLAIAAFGAGGGLALMALAGSEAAGMASYGVFGVSAAVFLALHNGQTLRVLPRPDRRGRDLGLFNLTNTIPSLIMPGIALALVPGFGFAGMFVLLAVLTVLAGALLVRLVRPIAADRATG